LIVPLQRENVTPYYLCLSHKIVPESVVVDQVIIKVNGMLQVFNKEKLPTLEMEKFDEG